MTDIRKFKLSDQFVDEYKDKKPDWGPVGEFTYLRTYARNIEEEGDRKENWFETVRRVVEGCFDIQKQHCHGLRLPWDDRKAQRSAKIMYEKIFTFKFLPSGRSLWLLGTDFVNTRGSACLNNCGACTTSDIDVKGHRPFTWTMDALMLGVGVGFDTKGAGKIIIKEPKKNKEETFVIPDSREGWVESLSLIIDAYFFGKQLYSFDYSLIRPYGMPIRGFGGKSSGPDPLKELHESIQRLLKQRIGKQIKSTDIVDIMNMIGVCVVAGNVRRCLAQTTLVYEKSGTKLIKDIEIGDEVLVSTGEYKQVVNKFDQGIQKIYKIKTSSGAEIQATGNHRVAVFSDFKEKEWKMIKDLNLNIDRLISIPHCEGEKTMTPERAWLYGLYCADGHVALYHQRGGTVTFSCNKKYFDGKLGENIEKYVNNEFNYKIAIDERNNSNSIYAKIYNKQITLDFARYKLPHERPKILPEIWNGTPEIRGAFLAGVADGDGDFNNNLVYTTFPEFAREIQQLALSLGVATKWHPNKPREHKDRPGTIYVACGNVSIRGIESQKNTAKYIQPWATRWNVNVKTGKKNGLNLPYQIILEKYKDLKHLTVVSKRIQGEPLYGRDVNYDTLIEKGLVHRHWIPLDIESITECGEDYTWDIEVEDNHEFVAENILVHNSAELAMGDASDEEFITMKDHNKYPEEVSKWRWGSNNSVMAKIGETNYESISKSITLNGEPGLIWLENIQKFGRVKDGEQWNDRKACLVNPCSEISLESYELCNLSELFPSRHESIKEFKQTIKYAYLYTKSVSLIPTHWPETNAVMMKNRRIGLSQSGIIDAFVRHGRRKILNWCDECYNYTRELDHVYSDWLCIPKSIKITTVKPSGTCSLLPGVSPGIHYPHSEYYIRRIRIAEDDTLVKIMKKSGYEIEKDQVSKGTMVVSFPIHEQYFERKKDDITLWEQFKNCADYQHFWADNNVSITVTFKKEEAKDIPHALSAYEDKLKAISLLPLSEHGYQQAPYSAITKEEFEEMSKDLKPIDFSKLTSKPVGERFCTSDKCML